MASEPSDHSSSASELFKKQPSYVQTTTGGQFENSDNHKPEPAKQLKQPSKIELQQQSQTYTDVNTDIDANIIASVQVGNNKPSIILWSYRIITFLLLLYSVFGVTYILVQPSSECKCNNNSSLNVEDTKAPTSAPSVLPTSTEPTLYPSMPTTSPVNPSTSPTISPSNAPTDFNGYYVGDYKISAQQTNHGPWILCDGSIYNSTEYVDLFDIIGHSFDEFNLSFGFEEFIVPDAMDYTIGITGSVYDMGSIEGEYNVNLTDDNLPEHHHYLSCGGSCSASGNNAGFDGSGYGNYLALDCNVGGIIGEPLNYELGVATCGGEQPWYYRTSKEGKNSPFSVMQPTLFAGNLFIYSGVFG